MAIDARLQSHMARFNLAQYVLWKASSEETVRTLPEGGVFLLMSSLTSMSDYWNWMDDGVDLTDTQWDDLQTDLADLHNSLLIEENPPMNMPIGIVSAFAGSPGSDWLRCDGTEYQTIDQPALQAVIHENFWVDADSFCVPDLNESFIRGALSTEDTNMGDTGGLDEVTLTVQQMPSHNHNIFFASDATNTGGVSRLKTNNPPLSNNTNIGYSGGGTAHENQPPYLDLEYWIKRI